MRQNWRYLLLTLLLIKILDWGEHGAADGELKNYFRKVFIVVKQLAAATLLAPLMQDVVSPSPREALEVRNNSL